MGVLFRHLKSLILPLTVLVIIPWFIVENSEPGVHLLMIPGAILILSGLLVMGITLRMFAEIGKGTLAPWDPAENLITTGIYSFVRNPMIMGVLSMLIGEALVFKSWRIAVWAALFFILNTIYFIYIEETGLEKRFGEEYVEYKKRVPRWVPKFEAGEKE